MSIWTTRAPLFIALALATTSAPGCGLSTREVSPEIADVVGDPDLPPDQWDLAPVVMAVESNYTLQLPEGVVVHNVDTLEASVTARVRQDAQSVWIESSDPSAGQLVLELERDGVTFEDISIDIEVLEPDTITLEGEGTEHVFVDDAFSIGYTLAAEDEVLVGHGFQPFDAPEGVSIGAVIRDEPIGLLNTLQRRELTFAIDPEAVGFELVARRGGQDHTFTRANQDMELSLTFRAGEDDGTEQVSADLIKVRNIVLPLVLTGHADRHPIYGGSAVLQTTDADCAPLMEPAEAVDGVFTFEPSLLASPTFLLANADPGETLTCEYEAWIDGFPDASQTLTVEFSPEDEEEGG